MGNNQSQEADNNNTAPQISAPKVRLLPIKQDEHLMTTKDGQTMCTCGFLCGTVHMYNLHVEHHVGVTPPFDPSGWPERQFKTVPYVNDTQRGVVARGDINHALFTTIYLKPGFDKQRVKDGLSQFESLIKKVAGTGHLVALIGVSYSLWNDLGQSCPNELKKFDEVSNEERVLFPATGGDIFLLAKSNDRIDLCYQLIFQVSQFLDENILKKVQTVGFRYNGGKDLTGFVDGTRNPDHLLRALVDVSIIFPDDDGNAHVGGSYMYAGRFVHDLKKFFKMNDQDKSNIIGRDYTVISPHHGYDQRPENPRQENAAKSSHVERAHGPIYRQAYPYTENEESGLYFCAFSRSLLEIEKSIHRMAGKIDGITDNLLSITKSVSNNFYYCPSLPELRALDSNANVNVNSSQKTENVNSNRTKKIIIEYCTNCGYRTIFNEMKAALELNFDDVEVIGNPMMPQLSAFEVNTEDGFELWSKLKQPNGRNNYPEVFPKQEVLVVNYRKHRGLPVDDPIKRAEPSIYQNEKTRVGVW